MPSFPGQAGRSTALIALGRRWPDSGPDAERQVDAAVRHITGALDPRSATHRQVTVAANILRHWWPAPAERGLVWLTVRAAAAELVEAVRAARPPAGGVPGCGSTTSPGPAEHSLAHGNERGSLFLSPAR